MQSARTRIVDSKLNRDGRAAALRQKALTEYQREFNALAQQAADARDPMAPTARNRMMLLAGKIEFVKHVADAAILRMFDN